MICISLCQKVLLFQLCIQSILSNKLREVLLFISVVADLWYVTLDEIRKYGQSQKQKKLSTFRQNYSKLALEPYHLIVGQGPDWIVTISNLNQSEIETFPLALTAHCKISKFRSFFFSKHLQVFKSHFFKFYLNNFTSMLRYNHAFP